MYLDGDESIALLSDGGTMCKNCTYRCSVCETETRETGCFIVTDDQVFCETCFRWYRCRKRLYVGDGEAPPARMQNTDSPLYSYHCADCVKEASKKQKIKHKKKQSDVVQEMAGSGAAGRSASSSKTTLAQDKSAPPTTDLNVPDLVIQNSPNQPSRMISNSAAKPFGPVLTPAIYLNQRSKCRSALVLHPSTRGKG